MLQYYLSLIETEEDKKTFSEIYEVYQESLYNYSFSLLKNASDAEDALQNAFCNIIRAMSVPEDIHSTKVKNYLYATVHHCCVDILREKQKRGCEISVDLYPDIFPDNKLLDEQYFVNETYREAIEKLKSFSPEMVAPFTLYYYNNFSYTQVANLLNITEVAARKRVSRERKAIKAAIGKGESDEQKK